ncbi:MAG TPA: TlpA disulfide reductase family protein [Vicinamibacteria bacterium]|nr:TlpA disulfide reductase family protein [Vicinamibacteria bacterium]
MRDGGWVVTGALLVGFVSAARAQAPPANPPPAVPLAPAIGDVIPSFDTEGIDGQAQHVGFPKGSPTVVVFFLSGCPACHKMIPEWNSAFARKPKRLRMIGVLMDQEPPGFFAATPIAFPVVRAPGREFLQKLKVNRAPVTLRVADGGKVEDAALGPIDPIRLGEFFHP